MQEQGQQDDEEEDRTTTAAATPPSKSRRNLILVSVLSVALLAWAIVVTVMYSNVSAQVRRGVGKSSTTSSQSQLRVSSMGNNGTATAGNDDDDDDTTSAQQPQQQQCLRTDVRPLPTEPTIKLSTAQNALNYGTYLLPILSCVFACTRTLSCSLACSDSWSPADMSRTEEVVFLYPSFYSSSQPFRFRILQTLLLLPPPLL